MFKSSSEEAKHGFRRGRSQCFLPWPCNVLRVLSQRVTTAQLMRSNLLSCNDSPTRRRVFESSVGAAHVGARKDVTVPSYLSVHPCLVRGCRKGSEPPLSAVIHLLGINCSSILSPPVQGPWQLEQRGAGSASSLPGTHPWWWRILRTHKLRPGAFKPYLDFSLNCS